MKHILTLCLTVLALLAAQAQDGKSELLQTIQKQGVVQDLEADPDGVTIRILPDGGFQIFSVGTGTYDLDDVDDIMDAQKEATLKAKANLAKFMSESISTDEKLEKMSAKVKKLSSGNDSTGSSMEQVSSKQTLSTIRSSSAALLKGVIVLSSSKTPGKGTSGTFRVMVGVSSKTLAVVEKVDGGTARESAPAALATSTSDAAAAGETRTSGGTGAALPEGWIECIGQGTDRRSAVSAALIEGIQQVYGLSLQNDSRMKERMQKFKVNTKALRISSKESESNTLTQTAGFVKEYRIIRVDSLGDGRQEATIHALIVNPRAGGVVAVVLYKPEMPLEDLTKSYDLGPGRRLSGSEIADVVGKTFNQAFSNANKFLVLDMDDLGKVVGQQQLGKAMVAAGLAPSQELMKAGQILTADYILTSAIEDLKYSRTLGMNKKSKKFEPLHKMSIRLNWKLTDVTTGETALSEVVTAKLENEEIAALLEEDEEADLLLALMKKVTGLINEKIPRKSGK